MKHKYFGDINDYRKYGLLRILSNYGKLKSSICWMLTPDDGSNDRRHLDYLKQPEKWRAFDPVLFDFLHENIEIKKIKDVNVLQRAGIVPAAHYYSSHLPDDATGRKAYFSDYMRYSENMDLIFFDPDNGIEVKSINYGSKDSSKYIYWSELVDAYAKGSSLLTYQHFPRITRSKFIEEKVNDLVEKTGADCVFSFRTPNVLFLLASQKRHRESFIHSSEIIKKVWGDQIICNLHGSIENEPIPINIQVKKVSTSKGNKVIEMTETCDICGCKLNRGTEYAKPTIKGRSHATKHHYVAERFFGRSTSRVKTERDGVFKDCPWGYEKETGTFCYECHEELLHNPVILPDDIQKFNEIVKLRALNEIEKSSSRIKLAGRIQLFREIISIGIRELHDTERKSDCE
ncbi:hypothetical protein KKB99_00295 [bacterium]|nr:hypothetical protein [bacterium]MBU1024424.1 hypothetical protein [bacterium]